MQTFRRTVPLIASVGVVLAMGAVGLSLNANANRTAQAIHRADRVTLETTLTSLTKQYLLFGAKDAMDYAARQRWTLRPNDARDRVHLKVFVERSRLLNHGAVLVDLGGRPLNQYAKAPGLPAATDPGFTAMRLALLRGELGLSSAMQVDGITVAALAVPIEIDGSPKALFVGFMRADTGPLQTYNARIRYGRTGRGVMLDSNGVIFAASSTGMLGTRYPAENVRRRLAAGESGFVSFMRGPQRYVAAFSPVGIGGWGSVIEQTHAEFFGPIASGGRNVVFALLALLAVAAALLGVLNHKRQTALQKAYEYKGQLLANTTHELKTPLTAIRGAAMTLGMRWREMAPEQVDQFLGIVHRRCDALDALIERILMGARLEAGRSDPILPEPINLDEVLRRAALEYRDVSPHHSIECTSNTNAWVNADIEAIEQVLGLLVENAIKYSPEGGRVRIEAQVTGTRAAIHIADDGIGIKDEDVAHVFEPYFKASRGDAQHFGGVGLGLSIARHLVDRHGGELSVTSAPGEGSVFTFTLEICEPTEVRRVDLAEVS
ncbi:MAG TPA: sensor histidine kinase [Actinomycetota bacterium]|nr:sensor histidine kinase [Actinomycetota bacterium]